MDKGAIFFCCWGLFIIVCCLIPLVLSIMNDSIYWALIAFLEAWAAREYGFEAGLWLLDAFDDE